MCVIFVINFDQIWLLFIGCVHICSFLVGLGHFKDQIESNLVSCVTSVYFWLLLVAFGLGCSSFFIVSVGHIHLFFVVCFNFGRIRFVLLSSARFNLVILGLPWSDLVIFSQFWPCLGTFVLILFTNSGQISVKFCRF